jgi:fused signal recognition particle receptor
MKALARALAKTRSAIADGLGTLFRGRRAATEEDLEAWEESLLRADVPLAVVTEIMDGARERRRDRDPAEGLESMLLQGLRQPDDFSWARTDPPHVVLLVGVNGCGKTTTAAKMAAAVQEAGLSPLLAATDTYRAAGADQLRIWADRLGCDVVAGAEGLDAAAVCYDAVDAAMARGKDVVLVDTAGRMHTRGDLMRELDKVRRSIAKRHPSAPHETWLVLDAMLGQNAIRQAEIFHDAVQLTGVVVAKLDGSAKAGFVFALEKEFGLPIRFVGVGEGAGDLVPFDRGDFVAGLLASE